MARLHWETRPTAGAGDIFKLWADAPFSTMLLATLTVCAPGVVVLFSNYGGPCGTYCTVEEPQREVEEWARAFLVERVLLGEMGPEGQLR